MQPRIRSVYNNLTIQLDRCIKNFQKLTVFHLHKRKYLQK